YLGQSVAQSPFKQTIDKAVMQWMQYHLSRKMPGLPELPIEELLKGSAMLETNIERILAKTMAEGVLLGEIKGKLEGKLEGKLKGESILL
ncbi:hypothetical protein JZU57_02840, partial [bacterium]|nr:hypothetical protein [bacterium]